MINFFTTYTTKNIKPFFTLYKKGGCFVMFAVHKRQGETVEMMIARFKKKVSLSGILEEIKLSKLPPKEKKLAKAIFKRERREKGN